MSIARSQARWLSHGRALRRRTKAGGLRGRPTRMSQLPRPDAGDRAHRRSRGRAAHPRAPGTLGTASHRERSTRARLTERRGHPTHLSPSARHRVVLREGEALAFAALARRVTRNFAAETVANGPREPERRRARRVQARRSAETWPATALRRPRGPKRARRAEFIFLSFRGAAPACTRVTLAGNPKRGSSVSTRSRAANTLGQRGASAGEGFAEASRRCCGRCGGLNE